MRISDWSSDVCSSDLHRLWNLFYFNQIASAIPGSIHSASRAARSGALHGRATDAPSWHSGSPAWQGGSYDSLGRSEEHTSELQSLMRISYAVFCLKTKHKKIKHKTKHKT